MFAEKNVPNIEPQIHVITLKEDSTTAIDASFEMIDSIYANIAEGTPVRFLFDASGVQHLPLKYALEQYKQYSFRNPRHRESRMAVILPPHVFTLSIAALSKESRFTLRLTDNIRFYPTDRAEQARQWLNS